MRDFLVLQQLFMSVLWPMLSEFAACKHVKLYAPFATELVLAEHLLLAVRGNLDLEKIVTLLRMDVEPERRDHAAFDDGAI